MHIWSMADEPVNVNPSARSTLSVTYEQCSFRCIISFLYRDTWVHTASNHGSGGDDEGDVGLPGGDTVHNIHG